MTKVSPVTGLPGYPGEGWTITSGFATEEYYRRFGDWHTGHDLAKSRDGGETVYAVQDGIVKWAEFAGERGFGNLVFIQHEPALFSRYGHLAQILVGLGPVSAGTPIGTIGSTGRSTAPHLHFDIARTNNAGDWPGKDKTKVFENYIDPSYWYAEAATTTVDAMSNQQARVTAPAGLHVRVRPGRTAEQLGKLPFGTILEIKPIRFNDGTLVWRELVAGGWVAEKYLEILIAPVLSESTTSMSHTVSSVTETRVFVLPRGVHASAGGWAPSDEELNLVRHNGVQSVIIAAYQSGQAILAVQKFKDAGVRDFIVRATSSKVSSDPGEFVNDSLPKLQEYYQALGNSTPMLIAVHNEPNLVKEGWTTAWQNGTEFSRWYLHVVEAYRQYMPGALIGFPAMSPGKDELGVRMDEWSFLADCGQAIAASDWVGVHAYFVGDGSDIDLKPNQWREMARGKPIIITEGGPADTCENSGERLKNAYAACERAGFPMMAWVLSGAGAWENADWIKRNVRF